MRDESAVHALLKARFQDTRRLQRCVGAPSVILSPRYGQAHRPAWAWVMLRRTDWSGDVTSFLPGGGGEQRRGPALDIDERDPWAHLTHGFGPLPGSRRHGEAERSVSPGA